LKIQNIILKGVLVGLGVGAGSVIYDFAFRASPQWSWWRIAVIGFIAGVIAAAWAARKPPA